MAKIVELNVYPIKSLGAVPHAKVPFTELGFVCDRIYMLVDKNGVMVTLRHYPELARFSIRMDDRRIIVDTKKNAFITLPVEEPSEGELPEKDVTIHDEVSQMLRMGRPYDEFFSDVMKRDVYLMRSASWLVRKRHSDALGTDVPLYAQDGYPLMLAGTGSLALLNQKLPVGEEVQMVRFRPNIVIDEKEAHGEDALRELWIGSHTFDRPKLCSRCAAITVHVDRSSPHFGQKDPGDQPMTTLQKYRMVYRDQEDMPLKARRATYFGVNVVPRGSGVLELGMEVTL